MTNTGKKAFSSMEVAQILKISRIAVFKKIKSGEIYAEKIGRNFIVPREEVMKALGHTLREGDKNRIDAAVRKAVSEYGETFKKLGRE